MYGSNDVGMLAALPATGAATGSLWLFLAGLTILLVGLALLRLRPKKES